MTERDKVILDDKKGEALARLGGEYRRMVFMMAEAFVNMMKSLNIFGSAGFTMFYMMGHEKGHYDVLKEIERLRHQQISFTKRQVIENIVQQLSVTGWGAVRVQKYDEKRGGLTIMVEYNPLVPSLEPKKESETPICYYWNGYWVGALSEVLERKVDCVETKCMAMGNAYCEFQITATS